MRELFAVQEMAWPPSRRNGREIIGSVETTVNDAFGRFENSATSFQSLIAGSADDLEQKVDGAAERLYVRIAETAEQGTSRIDEIGRAHV